MNLKTFYRVKMLINIIIFIGIVNFEKALYPRNLFLYGIFVLIILSNLLKSKVKKHMVALIIIEVFLIFLLEYNSKFIMNYFIHILYVLMIFELSVIFKIKKVLLFCGLIIVISSIKLVSLLSLQMNFENISITFFIVFLDLFAIFLAVIYWNFRKQKTMELAARASEERNQISREIHDVLGHNLTGLIMQLEMIDRLMDKDIAQAKKILNDCKKDARKNLSEVRNIVETIYDSDQTINIHDTIKKYESKADFTVDFVNRDEINYNYTLNRIIQEALTNIYKHSDASKVKIEVYKKGQWIYFEIKDNGMVSEYKEGFGLRNIKNRVQANDGEVYFSICGGFIMKGRIKEKNE